MRPATIIVMSAGLLLAAACKPQTAATSTPSSDVSRGQPPAPTSAPVAGAAATQAFAADWILPGAFTPATTLAQLQQRFGDENVRIVDDLPMAEGETTRGVLLFADDPVRRATVYFQDSDKLLGLSGIVIEDAQSRWQFDNGVRVGMSLKELVALNGAPLTYYGLSWDYGGHVIDWHGGKLQTMSDLPGRYGVRLTSAPDAPAGSYPQGDSEYRSDDKRWPKAGDVIRVGELMYSFPGQDDP